MTVRIGKWKPPQRPNWVKEVMKTPGYIKIQLLLLTTLTISSVLSTALLIFRTAGNTSDESILHSVESLEVQDAKLRVRVTGKHTTEVLRNLQQTGNFWGIVHSVEKSSPSTEPLEK